MFEMLGLAHPPLGPQPIRTSPPRMRVAVTEQLGLPLPVLAYDLPWADVEALQAAVVADALDAIGITVAALQCELGEANGPPSAVADARTSRLCPYRPDRCGLTVDDLTAAKIVDIRLTSCRHGSGRFVYSPEQMQRWDLRLAKATKETHSNAAMPIPHWPPDVATTEKLAGKVSQLRHLAPAAAICVSLGADSLHTGLPIVARSKADLLAIRADHWPAANGAQLAGLILAARRWLNTNDGGAIRLIVVPPPTIDADDVVKLLALGANAVAVDGWCRKILARSSSAAADEWAAATLGVNPRTAADAIAKVETVALEERLARIAALVESTGVASVAELGPQHLLAFDSEVPGVRHAGL